MEIFANTQRKPDADQGGALDESRRDFLRSAPLAAGALGIAALGSTAPAVAATSSSTSHLSSGARMESSFLYYDDPREHQRQSYRILRNTHDDADVLFWYHFTMFSVPVGKAPQPVVRWEGIEFSHHRRLADGVYRVHGHNLSFPRDLATGRWTDSALNPVTGEHVEIAPMALTEDPGYIYLPEGVIPLDKPDAPPRVRVEQFLIEDDLVKIEQVRLPPASWPVTFIETSSNWSSRELFENSDEPSLPTGTAGGYVFPWPEWMQMGDAPGHMFATWHGRKIGGVEQLPAHFIERAQPAHEALLSVDLSVFDTSLPPALAARIAEAEE